MKRPKWHLKLSKDGKFYFTLSSPNGDILLTSETYESKQGALNGIKSIRSNVGADIQDLTLNHK